MSKKKRPDSRQQGGRQRGSQSRPQGRSQSVPVVQQSRPPRREPSRGLSRKTLVGLAAGAVLVLVGVVILVSLSGSPATPPAATISSPGEGAAKGSEDALLTVDEYSDFQCPFCARFALDTFPRIDDNYIKPGKVRWVFHHFARIGPESVSAAQASECAGEQSQFWPYHDKLFANQQGENRGAFSSSQLRSFAKDIVGLDVSAFGSCLDSGRWLSKVSQDLAEGERRGVKGTPSFFIGGKMVEGARPYNDFQAAIEEALR